MDSKRLEMVHTAMRARRGRRCLVVVPSRAIERWHEPPAEAQAYEERLLCMVLMLRDPGLHLVYVTSSPVAPAIVGYYLSLLPQAVRRDARARLTLLSASDRSARPLTEKLLERPHLLTRIRWCARPCEHAVLLPYMTTPLERDLALALDMPLYGADPRHLHHGTKSGGRAVFARAGVPHPLGAGRITSTRAAIEAIARLRAAKPDLAEAIVKLDDAVSGEGNAVVDLRGLPRADGELRHAAERLARMTLEAGGVSVDAYLAALSRRGGVIEERITGAQVRSPSVQLEITPTGAVEIVSTHDQILAGQSYLGCRFPAAPSYAATITGLALKIGRCLADDGVIGRSAVDFVVARDHGGGWKPSAIEINLRSGGTTHPFAALALLTGGGYDADAATFTTAAGVAKHYVATDDLEAPSLRALGRDGLLALLHQRRLGFDHARRCGVVFHMLSSLDELGRVGLTAVGDSALDARRRYEQAQAILLETPRLAGAV